ncbi:DUF2809 domain-containing protein [Clostridium tarantellae]|uniref:DUF2809 domain-containing protein n=1 Tax=Clostridium tarantellae TaxID=39493 RepID=A0A6I1MR95_9CLOT|nr:DUF2809 domain-containing protein [Clostridium tarantellae]MPQ45313.1 DUF2809 domain-containing protein [Clostridium tarantellae]
MKINLRYLVSFIILFLVESFIAIAVKNVFIRAYIGDVLVIILMYTLIKTFISKPIKLLPIYLFVFASFIEVLQYFNIVEVLQLQNNKIVATIIGNTFDIKDILCYLIGAVILLIWDKIISMKFKY